MRLLGVGGGYETNPRQGALLRGERRVRSTFWTKSVKIMNASRKSTECSLLRVVRCWGYFYVGRETYRLHRTDACFSGKVM